MNLTPKELEAVKFAVRQDLEILSRSIADSDVGIEDKIQYADLKNAYSKLFGELYDEG